MGEVRAAEVIRHGRPVQRESNVFDAKSDRRRLVNGPAVDAVPRDPARVWHSLMKWAPENGISPAGGQISRSCLDRPLPAVSVALGI